MNSRLITLYSDRQTQVPNLTVDERRDILALKDLLGSQHVLLQANDSLLIMHYVGFIARGKTRLQILPKIYADYAKIANEEEKSESVSLLLRLLSYSGYINYKEIPDPQSIESCDNDLFEIFINIFVSRFLDVFKRNVHRSYEAYEENKQFIKGKILFHETILKNCLRKDRHYIRYDEFTVDTLLNRIFKTVLIRLMSQTVLGENKKKLKQALNHLEEVEPVELYKGIFDRVIFNRMNDIYQPILSIAKLLYNNRQPGFSEGDENTFTFLVPLNKLFEYYAYKLIDNYSQKSDFWVRYQGPEKHLALHKETGHFPLKPDITIFRNNVILYVIDAKFKNPFDKPEQIDLVSTDIYQIVTYAVCYRCENVFLLYPRFKGQPIRDTELVNYKIPTKTGNINLRILQIDIMQADNKKTQIQLVESLFGAEHSECLSQELHFEGN